MEIWKDIKGFPNYQISNFGEVLNKKDNRLLKIHRSTVSLYLNGIKIDIPLLKLMREYFTIEEDLSKFARVKSLSNEIWLPVKNYENFYHISNMGRLKILDRVCWKSNKKKDVTKFKCERLSAGVPNDKGYPQHILINENSDKWTRMIHLIVAEHFIPNPENKPQVNHKNGIKTDNRVENLEWVTAKENSQHAYETGLTKAIFGDNHYQAKINSKKAMEIKLLLKNKNNRTLQEIADICNVNRSIVKNISQNSTWKHINV